MKIAVPRTAPATLLSSKFMVTPHAASAAENTGGHYPPRTLRHCGEASHKCEALSGLSAHPGLNSRRKELAREPDPPDPGPHGLNPLAEQAFGRDRGRSHDRAGLGPG